MVYKNERELFAMLNYVPRHRRIYAQFKAPFIWLREALVGLIKMILLSVAIGLVPCALVTGIVYLGDAAATTEDLISVAQAWLLISACAVFVLQVLGRLFSR